MSRLKLIAVLLFVAFIAAEPLLHEHPLQSNEAIVCAACAAGTVQLAVHAPAVVAPLTVVGEIATISHRSPSTDISLSLPSRAPPAA